MDFADITKCRETWRMSEKEQYRLLHKIPLVLSS